MSTTIYAQKHAVGLATKKKFQQDNNLQEDFVDRCVFCFAGANQIKKGIGTMVDAFTQLNHPKTALVLALKNITANIGPHQYEGEYDMHDLVSHPNIYVIHAALSDHTLADLYRMSDFLLYPSQGEAPGLQVSEAQLCGCIPICTDYAGLPEESCFPEFLIRDYRLFRGQVNCYRAIVDANALRALMERGIVYWEALRNPDDPVSALASERYDEFMASVEQKFRNRSWAQAAAELHDVIQSLTQGGLRVDQQLVKL